ncbi:MAG: T9SS type A sorting domain-containing protein [Syntrophothermus sp.]
MLKKIVTLSVLLLVIVGVTFAQTSSVKVHNKVVLTQDNENKYTGGTDYNYTPKFFNPTVGDTLGTTTYDYFTNSMLRKQVVTYQGQPYFANMFRPYGGSANRQVVFTYLNASNAYTQVSVFGGAAGSGFPDIDVSLTGDLAGTVALVGHTPDRLAIWDPTGAQFSISQFSPGLDPSLRWSGPNIFLASSGNATAGRDQFQFFKTEDLGLTFVNWDSISARSFMWAVNGTTEMGIAKSPNEQYLVYFGANSAGDNMHVYNGVPEDSADNVFAVISSDAGTTWTDKRVEADGVIGLVQGYPDFAPLIENFGQIDMAITNTGVLHVVANGYGLTFTPAHDSSNGYKFPIIYWNSVSNKWTSLTLPALDENQAIADLYPGNGIGFGYPSISISEDGQVIYVQFSGPQFTNNQLDTIGGFYKHDTYHCWSLDGGATWSPATVLAGDKNIDEIFANVAQYLTDDGANYTAHSVYLADAHTGVFVFGEGVSGDEPIIYKTVTVPKPTGVNDNITVNNFELQQNYPNPFNPSTLIKFSIAERSNVTLKVFDMLGREVATLLNGVQEAGSHQVTFDASKLSTGMYIYTINAGNFSESKKMMLLK